MCLTYKGMKMNLKGAYMQSTYEKDKESEMWVNRSIGVVIDTTFLSLYLVSIWMNSFLHCS